MSVCNSQAACLPECLYSLSLVKQCTFLDPKLKINSTALMLSDIGGAISSLKDIKKSISSADWHLML